MPSIIDSLTINQLFSRLGSGAEGLSVSLAEKRIKEQKQKFKIESQFSRGVKLLIRQFANPLMLLLVVAVILSAILGERSDTLIISFIILATGLLSFWQELNANNAVESLRRLVEVKHTVLRENKQITVNTIEVVP